MAVITLIGGVASVAFSASAAKAESRVTIVPSSTEFMSLAPPQPELSFNVSGTISWETRDACRFGDTVPAPTIVFSDEHGVVVGVVRPGPVTEYWQFAPLHGGASPWVICTRKASYSGTLGQATWYHVAVGGTLVARISLGSLRERGFVLDVVFQDW